MIAAEPSDVSEAILHIFSVNRELSVSQLHQKISSKYFSCSERAVYKELSSLEAAGVIVKSGKYYSISLTWALKLIDFSEAIYRSSIDLPAKHFRLPEPAERISWKFSDLERMDRLWVQLLFLLFERSVTRIMYVWVPYFWFDLVHYEKDREAQNAMIASGNKMYMSLGDDSYLSRLPERYWSKSAYEWSYAEGPFHDERSKYYDVIDDFVLTVTIDQQTTAKLVQLFSAIKSEKDMGLSRCFFDFKSDASAQLYLENNPAKAKRLRNRFRSFFGH
jgi:hypothetical protein